MTSPELDRVLLTSVLENERPFAREALAGAHLVRGPLSPSVADEHREARILSLTIHDPVDTELLERFEDLEALITRSDGYDHLPAAWLEERGVPAYHLEGYATAAVTEHALAALITLARRWPEAQAQVLGEKASWERAHLVGRGLPDLTVGVLGVGRIGSSVARRLVALGAQVLGHDIDPDPRMERLEGFRYAGSFQALLEGCDALTVHVPLDETTRGMVDADALALMPEDALLVNTARGDVVDQAAVAEALQAGRLAGYAADVMPGEPDPPDVARFRGREDVLITPHLAAYDERTIRARYERTAEIVEALLGARAQAVDRFRVY